MPLILARESCSILLLFHVSIRSIISFLPAETGIRKAGLTKRALTESGAVD